MELEVSEYSKNWSISQILKKIKFIDPSYRLIQTDKNYEWWKEFLNGNIIHW